MGFTIAGPDRFLASGHPDLRDYRAGRLPPRLGLLESTDGGVTWRPLSLLGQADFHALRSAHGQVYGLDVAGGSFMVSKDGSAWETRAKPELFDFAVSPRSTDLILATAKEGLRRSDDGGRTWTAAAGPLLLFLAWPEERSLWGVTAEGVVHHSQDAGGSWTAKGNLQGAPEAILVEKGIVYTAVHGQGIFASEDEGKSWQALYRIGT